MGDPAKQGTLTFSGGTLVLSGVPRRSLPPELHALGTWDARLPAWRCGAVHYLQLKLLLDDAGISRDDTVAHNRSTGRRWNCIGCGTSSGRQSRLGAPGGETVS